eukprot:c30669_g1_i1 orf=2-172(-)
MLLAKRYTFLLKPKRQLISYHSNIKIYDHLKLPKDQERDDPKVFSFVCHFGSTLTK